MSRTFAIAAALFAMPLMSETASAKPKATYPGAIHGIWMNDDAEGRAQCRSYLAGLQQDGVEADAFLVGSEVIRDNIWHSYAEYGEGNSYAVRSSSRIGVNAWRFHAAVGIDTLAEEDAGGIAVFRVTIAKGALTWHMESFAGNPVDSWDEHRYFRCADVPAGMYGS